VEIGNYQLILKYKTTSVENRLTLRQRTKSEMGLSDVPRGLNLISYVNIKLTAVMEEHKPETLIFKSY
jgi:hypothetical protein